MLEKIKYIFVSICCLYLIGCSSGAYDIEEKTISYEEKTIIADTTKTVTEKSDEKKEIKEDLTNQKEFFVFVVQIGAFVMPSNFENFYQRAKSILGDEVYYEFKNGLYKIKLGKFDNRVEALQMLDKVREKGYYDAFVITVRNK